MASLISTLQYSLQTTTRACLQLLDHMLSSMFIMQRAKLHLRCLWAWLRTMYTPDRHSLSKCITVPLQALDSLGNALLIPRPHGLLYVYPPIPLFLITLLKGLRAILIVPCGQDKCGIWIHFISLWLALSAYPLGRMCCHRALVPWHIPAPHLWTKRLVSMMVLRHRVKLFG